MKNFNDFLIELNRFEKKTGIRYDLDSNINFSGQWIPYRGGIMIGYKF